MRYFAAVLAAFLGVAVMATPAMSAPVGTPTFSYGGMTSPYHLYADVDRSKEVGLLLYLDGSGGYGIDNPNQAYLIDADGTAGMRQVAKDNNMVLLVPEAPAPGDGDGDNCWYNESTSPNATAKSDWLRALVDKVQAEQGVVKSRVATGGYSSGAQGLSRWFLPRHGTDIQTDGVNVLISFGGAPAASAGTPQFTQAYKDAVRFHWDIGTQDTTGAYSNTAQWGGRTGANWYKTNGFAVTENYPNIGHNRSDFAAIMRTQIAAHVRPAAAVGSTTPAAYDHQITAGSTSARLVVDIPTGAPRLTWRMSKDPITTQTGFYDYTDVEGQNVVINTTSTLLRNTIYYYQLESGSRGNVVAKGTFKTLP